MKKQFRYFACGLFFPTDGEVYEINIPSPFLHNSKKEAMNDDPFGYRFCLRDDTIGPEIIVYEKENFEFVENGDEKFFKVWVDGNILKTYSFEEFKKENGYIRMLKPECKGSRYFDGNTDFIDTDKTFRDVFPNMKKQKLYPIGDEAYCIEEVVVE